MSKKKVLLITQEMDPYTALSEISDIAAKLPQYLHQNGCELRVLMPRFGTINERRHRLHEVVRLSGMNIIVNDDDFPLIIKVASMPNSRLQVYFLDNDEFFKRKSVFEDADGYPFKDNVDRAVFFCKGAIETVKKFGWSPDIVHCHGWMTSLIPMYIRTAYKTEPIFQQSRVIYSLYESPLERFIDPEFSDKASINNLKPEDLHMFEHDGQISLHRGGAAFADGVIYASSEVSDTSREEVAGFDKPTHEATPDQDVLTGYIDFYESLHAVEAEV